MLDSLATGYLKSVYTPGKHESFQVKIGDKTGEGGVLSGVLSEKDHAQFQSIIKGLNVKDASYSEMSEVYRKLGAAGLISENDILSSFMGSSEHDAGGSQVNAGAKYDQWQYHKDGLASYADPMFSETRERALNTFKLMAAIANASPVTGQTVARESVSAQDREQAVQVDLSEEARRRARKEDYGIDDREPDEAKFMNDLIEQMQEMAQAAKTAQNTQAADAATAASAPAPVPPSP
ncbi:hypothetical protein [Pseudomonas sp. KNUC1026]|uniref:hypothetical protein n=1 Tax=Pseudomonas sp. KNUC1026 TaxID=2893890 RepID=UPI001F3F65F0|nr:hypothetical protein [Pseudomonas sp. KNUC1026]UFH50703.1 hypothetical protein LN139_06015 [Pseudomonas sp. KNUC1026]